MAKAIINVAATSGKATSGDSSGIDGEGLGLAVEEGAAEEDCPVAATYSVVAAY